MHSQCCLENMRQYLCFSSHLLHGYETNLFCTVVSYYHYCDIIVHYIPLLNQLLDARVAKPFHFMKGQAPSDYCLYLHCCCRLWLLLLTTAAACVCCLLLRLEMFVCSVNGVVHDKYTELESFVIVVLKFI